MKTFNIRMCTIHVGHIGLISTHLGNEVVLDLSSRVLEDSLEIPGNCQTSQGIIIWKRKQKTEE